MRSIPHFRRRAAALPAIALGISLAALGGCGDDSSTSDAPKAASGTASGTGVVATVNGTPITEADLELAEAEIGSNLGQVPPATRRRVLVEYLVENQLFADAALREKLASGPDFDKRVAYWRQRALRETYFDKAVKSTIGEAAAKSFYDDQVKLVKPEEEIQARHILVESEEKANEIAGKIAGGADFAQMAKEHSTDAGSKEEGGMLDFFGHGQMVPQFESAAFALAKGEVSKPVQSRFGWHLIKLEDKREKAPPTFDEVKDQIIGSMVQNKAQQVAAQLREGASIEYVDADIKKQVDDEKVRAAAQKKAMDEQMLEQIKRLEAEPGKDGGSGAAPAEAPK